VIAHGENPERLYELDEQTRIQNEAWPDMKGSVLPGAYPPYVAYLAKPLVTLGPVGGKAAWTLVSLVSFFAAVYVLSRFVSTLHGTSVELSTALLVFSPVMMGVLGGQLLALSMLLYVLLMFLDRYRDVKSEVLLGVVIGVWLFKPHYALVALLMPLVQRRLWVLFGFTIPALIYFFMGVKVLGLDWLPKWVTFTRGFAEMNFASNAAQMSNVMGATVALTEAFQVEQSTAQLSRSIALGVCAVLVAWLAIVAWCDRRSVPKHGERPSRFLLLLGPTLALASPQANFYDLGLAAIPLVILLAPTVRDWIFQFGGCVACGLLAMGMRTVNVPLFAILSFVLFISVGRRSGFNLEFRCPR
jgi:hypothetical protein